MRLPAWVAPLSLALAAAAALALMIWVAYQAYVLVAGLVVYALFGLFVIGYGLDPVDPTVILTPGSPPPTGG